MTTMIMNSLHPDDESSESTSAAFHGLELQVLFRMI